MVEDLLFTLALSLGIQAVFFAAAAMLRTDKVTDLSYGLTFFAIAAALLARSGVPQGPQLLLAGMVMAWAVRLAGYLLYRIVHMGRDRRFDGVRERFWKFFQFWFFQGLVVWIVMLPTVLWFGRPEAAAGVWTTPMIPGSLVWLAGFILETVADAQKFTYKSREGTRARWMSTGLWRYSRHPNYFGELLCWWGLFIFVLPGLGWWAVAGTLGPLSLTYILLAVTGIPTLEKSAVEKWGTDPDYLQYRRATNRLLPWPRRS